METLPIDLITDIFLRLPAKTLIRFKIVCKLWYHIISDARFGSQHLERSISTDTNLHFVITSPMLRLADFDNPVELNYPYNDPDRGGVSIVGSCNGLLLLTIYDNYINEYNLSMMLYNPTTQTHKFLPLLPRPDQLAYPRGHYSYGLGFDSVSNDYKCVRIDQYSFKETDTEAEYFYSEVMVYSLRNDYWRRGPDVPHYFFNNWGFSVLFRETLHWVGHGGADDRVPQPIVGFNLQDENFSILLLPDFDMEYSVTLHLGVMDGCLCLLVNHIEYTDAWIMKEYGMVDSWIKLYSIVKRKDIQHVERTVCYSRSEKKLFIRICLLQLAYLDLETLETTNIKISDKFKCFDAYLCVENLLMLNDADYDSFEEELPSIKKRKKKGKKKRRRRKRHAR